MSYSKKVIEPYSFSQEENELLQSGKTPIDVIHKAFEIAYNRFWQHTNLLERNSLLLKIHKLQEKVREEIDFFGETNCFPVSICDLTYTFLDECGDETTQATFQPIFDQTKKAISRVCVDMIYTEEPEDVETILSDRKNEADYIIRNRHLYNLGNIKCTEIDLQFLKRESTETGYYDNDKSDKIQYSILKNMDIQREIFAVFSIHISSEITSEQKKRFREVLQEDLAHHFGIKKECFCFRFFYENKEIPDEEIIEKEEMEWEVRKNKKKLHKIMDSYAKGKHFKIVKTCVYTEEEFKHGNEHVLRLPTEISEKFQLSLLEDNTTPFCVRIFIKSAMIFSFSTIEEICEKMAIALGLSPNQLRVSLIESKGKENHDLSDEEIENILNEQKQREQLKLLIDTKLKSILGASNIEYKRALVRRVDSRTLSEKELTKSKKYQDRSIHKESIEWGKNKLKNNLEWDSVIVVNITIHRIPREVKSKVFASKKDITILLEKTFKEYPDLNSFRFIINFHEIEILTEAKTRKLLSKKDLIYEYIKTRKDFLQEITHVLETEGITCKNILPHFYETQEIVPSPETFADEKNNNKTQSRSLHHISGRAESLLKFMPQLPSFLHLEIITDKPPKSPTVREDIAIEISERSIRINPYQLIISFKRHQDSLPNHDFPTKTSHSEISDKEITARLKEKEAKINIILQEHLDGRKRAYFKGNISFSREELTSKIRWDKPIATFVLGFFEKHFGKIQDTEDFPMWFHEIVIASDGRFSERASMIKRIEQELGINPDELFVFIENIQ